MSKETFIDHDRLFKELIQNFFEEFMLLFFPHAYEAIDFNHVQFLSEEVITDITSGEKRRVDLLVQTKLKNHDVIINIHIENQAYIQKDFNERMFIYFSRLYEKYRRPILPIAVFSYDKNRKEPNYFTLEPPFFRILKFNFYILELRKKPWREYVKQGNPVSAALLSKMGYRNEERVQVKKEFLRMIVNLEINPAQMQLITGFFETYLTLTESEKNLLELELQKLSPEEEAKIMEWKISYKEEGRIEGLTEGLTKGKVDAICMYLQAKFGDSSIKLQQQISQLKDLSVLDDTIMRLYSADDLQDAAHIVRLALEEQK